MGHSIRHAGYRFKASRGLVNTTENLSLAHALLATLPLTHWEGVRSEGVRV